MAEKKAEETKAVATQKAHTRAGGQIAPLNPRTIDETWQMAKYLSASSVVPANYPGNPGSDQNVAAVFGAIQMGATVGLPPMAAVANIMVVNGKFAMYGDAQLAVVRDSGLLEHFEERFEGKEPPGDAKIADWPDDFVAVCTIKRNGIEVVERYSVADARRAGLWGKTGSRGPTPWVTNPKRMLRYRCRAFILRDNFGDVLLGLQHTVEELQDMGDLVETEPGVYEAPARPDPNDPKYAGGEEADQTPEADVEQPADDAERLDDLWPLFDETGEETGQYTSKEWSAAYIAGLGRAAGVHPGAAQTFIDNNADAGQSIWNDEGFDAAGVKAAIEAAKGQKQTRDQDEQETPETAETEAAGDDGAPAADADSQEPAPAPEEQAEENAPIIEVVVGDDGEIDWGAWFRSFQRRISGAKTLKELEALVDANGDMLYKECPVVWREQLKTKLKKRGEELKQ